MGVWLPLALADVVSLLICQIRMWAENGSKIEVPHRSETLAGWCLPMLSRSVKAGEDEQAALAMLQSVQRLAARQQAEARTA